MILDTSYIVPALHLSGEGDKCYPEKLNITVGDSLQLILNIQQSDTNSNAFNVTCLR